MATIVALLTLIIGLLLGFYGRTLYDRVNQLYAELQDRREAKQVGVVRPTGVPAATRSQPIDMSSDTGGIRKLSPQELEEERQKNRAEVLQRNHT